MQSRDDPIRQLIDLWRGASGVTKAAVIVVAVTLAGLLVGWYAQEPAHDTPVPASTDSAVRSPDAPEGKPSQKWALPIARPLQQGMERLAGELEETLNEMDGISKARVVLNRPEPALFNDDAAHVTAAICLWLNPDIVPSAAAIQGIAAYVSRAVPALTEKAVTIVDGRGRTLFLDGQVVQNNLRSLPTAAPVMFPSSRKSSQWWSRPLESMAGVTILGLVIAVALVAVGMMVWRFVRLSAADGAREKPETPPAAEGASPLGGLDAGAIAAALRFERPQVMAFALARMDPNEAAVVLEGMPEAVRQDMQERMARLGHVSLVIALAAEKAIAESARSLSASREKVNKWDGF